jgi:site-specific DNA recombinase
MYPVSVVMAGIYCRISQDRTGAGLGVERQEGDCRALAERLGWQVADVYADNDVSAYSGKKRAEYERLLADVEHGRIGAVLAWHADRLHRSPVELERYIGFCDPRGVPTHTVRAGELDLSTATGRMTARVVGAVARGESELKGERVKAQKTQAKARGEYIGGRRPFGYAPGGMLVRPTVDALHAWHVKTHDRLADKHPIPDDDALKAEAQRIAAEADALVEATRDVLAGHSIRSIVRRWNAAGLTTTSGQRWDASNLRRVLIRPRNAGLVGRRGTEPIGEAQWPALIERETWQALVSLLGDESRSTRTGGTSRKLLGSFLYRCECGELVRSGGQTPSGRDRYACVANHLTRVAVPIDALVLDVIAGVLDREGIELIAPAVDVTSQRERLAVLRARADEIATMLADPASPFTPAQLATSNKLVQAEIETTTAEMARLQRGSRLAGIADADEPGKAFRDADVDRQRGVIDDLAVVTLLRTRSGRSAGGAYFDPESVRIEPKTRARD